MKINILAGTRFQSGLVVNILSGIKHEVNIYSSSPKSKWNFIYKDYVTLHFIPFISAIFSHVTKITSSNFNKEISTVLFDLLSSIVMKKCNILHVWSSFGLYSIKRAKKNGSIIFVEKSCPHPYYQDTLLKEESKFLGIKYQEHSQWFLNRTLEEFELADKVVVCSNYTLNSFLDNGFPKEKLYNVALDSNFTPKKVYNRDFIKEELIIGTVGGNLLRKGFIYLLEAWQKIDIPNKKLLLKTSKSELEKVPKIWNLIEGDDSIEIIGYLNDMEDFYERCDLFVLPSIDEGFGMVVFEALACSLPVIITKNVGAGDFITNGEEGYIVDIRDSRQIKDKIEYLNKNREIMKTMSLNSKVTYDNYKTRDDNYQNRVKILYKQYEE